MSRERHVPSHLFSPGVSLLPEDFPARLTALKEITSLTWEGMSVCLGVDPRQLKYWRDGGWPNGGAMLALVALATRVPGGLGALLNNEGMMVVFRRRRQTMGERNRAEDCPTELFPKDFGERLERLIELAGLSWEESARILGVGLDCVTEWREGTIPTGVEVWRIMSLARSVLGGVEIMLPEAAGSDQGGK